MRPGSDGQCARLNDEILLRRPSRQTYGISSGRYKQAMSNSIEQLSFELKSQALSEQEHYLSSLRSSAGTVLGAASIAAPLLATRIVGRPFDIWVALAMIAFVLCLASAIGVLLPRELAVSFSGAQLIADGDRAVGDVSEAYRTVVRWSEPSLTRNRRTIDRLADWLTLSCLLLAVEIICCVIGLTS